MLVLAAFLGGLFLFLGDILLISERTHAPIGQAIAGVGGPFAILREIAGIVLGPTAAMAIFATLTACLRSALTIVGKVAGAMLPSKLSRACSALTIFSKVAWIPSMSLIGHRISP